jgi:hypothetical protein
MSSIRDHRTKIKWIPTHVPSYRTGDVYPLSNLIPWDVDPRPSTPFLNPEDPDFWQLWVGGLRAPMTGPSKGLHIGGWRTVAMPAVDRDDKEADRVFERSNWWPTSIGDRNSLRGKYYPNLLIRHKGSQRIYVSLNRWVVNSAAPGNSLTRSGLSVAIVLYQWQ